MISKSCGKILWNFILFRQSVFLKFFRYAVPFLFLETQLIVSYLMSLLLISFSIDIVGIGGHPSEWIFKRLRSSSKKLYSILCFWENLSLSSWDVWSSHRATVFKFFMMGTSLEISEFIYLAFGELKILLLLKSY